MRIGLVGFGFIGADLYRRIATDGGPGEIAFVHNRSPGKLGDVPKALVCDSLEDAKAFAPDLIVEVAGPETSRLHGETFLEFADYMPLSLTALADAALYERLARAAARSRHSLLVAHGALVGLDSLAEWREMWDEVIISFRKPPASLGLPAGTIENALIFDGSVREIAALYPHNVNAMVACALATTGLDKCRARLFADAGIDHLELSVEARGRDGSSLSICRRQPARGVSGSEMAAAVMSSVRRAVGAAGAVAFV